MRRINYCNTLNTSRNYYPFGMQMPGRSFNTGSYRFGLNGMELDNEISGNGNSYTAMFWQYDPRLGRRWNIDPVFKAWESSYATFGNKPIIYSDPLGLEVINGHKSDKEAAAGELKRAQEKFDGLKKGEEGYKTAKKEFKKARNAFGRINTKFLRVERKITKIKRMDPDLFERADKLTDPGGTQIDIYVYDTPNDVLNSSQTNNRGGGTTPTRYGTTDAQGNYDVTSYSGDHPDYTTVMSERHGNNTITIRISDIAKAIHLAHEFGHAIYQAKYMKEYQQWLNDHPEERGKGGHGKEDPSGNAAEDAEKKFK